MLNLPDPISFDRISERYDATRTLPPEQQNRIALGIMTAIRGRMGTRFVEPGVGTGRLALPLLRQGAEYVGVDVSRLMLDRLREKLSAEPWLAGRIVLREARAEALPLPDASCDAAITAYLLHLLPDWRRAIDEIKRVVRPGGYYIHVVDYGGGLREAFGTQWNQLMKERDLVPTPRRGATAEGVLHHLHLPPAALSVYRLARWRIEESLGEVLRSYRERDRSKLWALADADHSALMAGLERWSEARFGGAETVLVAEAGLNIAVIHLTPGASNPDLK
jgi:SAM-dependent methyltransferase